MRRTDFLPVGGSGEDEVLERGYDSLSDDDEDGPGREYACEHPVFSCEVDVSAWNSSTDHDYADSAEGVSPEVFEVAPTSSRVFTGHADDFAEEYALQETIFKTEVSAPSDSIDFQ